MRVIDQTAAVARLQPSSSKPYRIDHMGRKVVVHRFGPTIQNRKLDNALDVAREFARVGKFEPGSYTGGRMAYHFVINAGGKVYQALPLSTIGAHASGHNKDSWGVAVLQDLRHSEITYDAEAALMELCSALMIYSSLSLGSGGLHIHGHHELMGPQSPDPQKACPGGGVKLRDISDYVELTIAAQCEELLERYNLCG